MTNSDGHGISESQLFGALRAELPDARAMEDRVRARLKVRQEDQLSAQTDDRPRGLVLRFADWTGLSGVAASILGPVLLPLGLARAGTAGTLAAKGLLPKTLSSTLAMPLAFLVMIGLTLQLSLRRIPRLVGDGDGDVDVSLAVWSWWLKHQLAFWTFFVSLVLLTLASYLTAKALLFLAGIVALSLCAEALVKGRNASRPAIIKAACNIGLAIHMFGRLVVLAADTIRILLGEGRYLAELPNLAFDVAVLFFSVGILLLMSAQGRSRFLGPWRLMTEGTDLDIAKLAGAVLVLVSTPGLVLAQWFYWQEMEATPGELLWASRASLAWLAFCAHAVILVKRAPVAATAQP